MIKLKIKLMIKMKLLKLSDRILKLNNIWIQEFRIVKNLKFIHFIKI